MTPGVTEPSGVFVDKMILFSLVILPDSEVATRAPPQDRCT